MTPSKLLHWPPDVFVTALATSTAAPVRAVVFSVYAILAMFIHACLAIPAVIARFFTDVIGSGSIFEALKPSKRTDLY